MKNSKVYVGRDSEMNGYILTEIVNEHYNNSLPRLQYLDSLYRGEHEILNTPPKDANKPNNLLVNNYFGEIVDTAVGYFLGEPVVILNEDEAVMEEMEHIFDNNDLNDILIEVGKEASIKGRSALMVYQNEDSETVLVHIPADEVIFIYDSSRPDKLLYAIRVYEMQAYDREEKVKYAEVWSDKEVSYWVNRDEQGIFVLDDSREPEPHIFQQVPIIEVINNGERMGDFEKIITLVDDFDKVLSNASNELEVFRNAYLMLKNMTLSKDGVDKLKQDGIIEVMENGDVKFVTKDIPSEFMNKHLDRLQDNIYRFSQVPNLSDENFANNLSGVAIRFKLFGLETKCIQKERKLTKSLKKLLRLLSIPISVKTGRALELTKTDIKFVRNVPANLTELSDVVSKLNGLVDKETLLSIIPFVDDVKGVIEALERENNIMLRDMPNAESGRDSFYETPTVE